MIDDRTATLTAINCALIALDRDVADCADTDELVMQAMDLLLEARAAYTDKPWPEQSHPLSDLVAYDTWLETESAKQREAGLQ